MGKALLPKRVDDLKRIIAVLCLLTLLAGCAGAGNELDRAMALRAKMLAQGVAFDAEITADYGDKTYQFIMECQADSQGELTFTVKEPQSIAGITGKLSAAGGRLTFDDKALAFGLLADDQITPVSAPWILLRTLRSGYLTSCGLDGGVVRVAIDDSYEEDALHLDIWLDENDLPKRGEILWKGRRILSVNVKNFRFV